MTAEITLANGDSLPYFEGARDGKLLFQKCKGCGVVQFPPRHHCATCWEADLEWIASSGKGTVETYTIVRRAPLPAYREKVPYVIASIIVEEGPRIITSLEGDNALDVKVGDAVSVDYQDDPEGNTLPVFLLD